MIFSGSNIPPETSEYIRRVWLLPSLESADIVKYVKGIDWRTISVGYRQSTHKLARLARPLLTCESRTSIGLMNVALIVIGPVVKRKDDCVAVQVIAVRFATGVKSVELIARPKTLYAISSTTTIA